jgi:hypothetical protein
MNRHPQNISDLNQKCTSRWSNGSMVVWPIYTPSTPPGLVWRGEDTLCWGHEDPLPLVEKLLSGGGIKVTKGAWRVISW